MVTTSSTRAWSPRSRSGAGSPSSCSTATTKTASAPSASSRSSLATPATTPSSGCAPSPGTGTSAGRTRANAPCCDFGVSPHSSFSAPHRGGRGTWRLELLRRWDVVVQPEQVARVVPLLDLGEPLQIFPVGGPDELGRCSLLLTAEVQVGPTSGGEPLGLADHLTHPGNVLGGVGRVDPVTVDAEHERGAAVPKRGGGGGHPAHRTAEHRHVDDGQRRGPLHAVAHDQVGEVVGQLVEVDRLPVAGQLPLGEEDVERGL